jgi:hypothetical protein
MSFLFIKKFISFSMAVFLFDIKHEIGKRKEIGNRK